jgi:GT2 family glycosyltransferase
LSMLPGAKLDSRFFMYGEDQLWCEQIKGLGYQILFYSGTTIIHINNGSTDLSKQLKLRAVMMENELQILRQRKGKRLYYYIFKVIFVSKETIRTFIKFLILRINGRLIR